ncbi:MAG: PHP domain-containing protein [Burkholderiaceae bacterium]|nr:PHP domain-containing protein [Burkholderiaceae bacterium]MBP6814513.1 PHP domain-containing protein [Burkholderiaceae bacterium]MBP7658818.1 PHP domain-containing protein [Burkholderiaceae bacterium]
MNVQDPWRLNADLHCHSTISDGTLEPEAVVARAHAQGVELLSLTDHDELSGQLRAQAAADALGLAYVPGVEISVTWAGETIHVVGLGIDPLDADLVAGVARTRDGREERAKEMAEQLQAVGIEGSYEGALRYVGNPELISRTHFARHLVETGVCSDVGDVFQRFLSEGKPGFVPHRWAKLAQALGWILGAGGTPVLAHPGRYRLNDTALWALIEEFREAGGTGIEVVCGSHTRDQYGRFAGIAREFGLRASRGSDFHGPGESHVELGQLPPLPDAVVPVWYDWPVAGRRS